jgi:hypothetical protein
MQISVVFLFTNNKQAEKEIRKTISLAIAWKKKNLGINLTKLKDLYDENKTLKKEIREDTRR